MWTILAFGIMFVGLVIFAFKGNDWRIVLSILTGMAALLMAIVGLAVSLSANQPISLLGVAAALGLFVLSYRFINGKY